MICCTLIFLYPDINECEDDMSLCRGGTCRNLPGEYVCECPEGLELSLDGRSCIGKIIFIFMYHMILLFNLGIINFVFTSFAADVNV